MLLCTMSTMMVTTIITYISSVNLLIGAVVGVTQHRLLRIMTWMSTTQLGYVLLVIPCSVGSYGIVYYELYCLYTILALLAMATPLISANMSSYMPMSRL